MLRRSLLLALIPLTSLSFAQYAGSDAPPAELNKGLDSITIPQCREWLGFLAGPQTEGRGTGQPGFQKAADFVASKFRAWGLKPVGEKGTFFQMVPFSRTTVDNRNSFLELSGTRVSGDAIGLNGATGDVDLDGEVVIVRANGRNAALPEGADVNGKVLLVYGQGISRAFRSSLFSHSPAAVLTVVDKVTPSINIRRVREDAPLPAVAKRMTGSIDRRNADQIARQLGTRDPEVKLASMATNTVELTPSDKRAHISIKTRRQTYGVPNVVGLLEGSDAALKTEIVGVGAHLDHLGIQNGTVYPGADDDGSGSTAVLAIVKAFHDSGVRPKRSILFMTFCGEEMGLIGSGYYSDNPLFPHERMVAELQMDMVGRDSDGVQNGDQSRVDKASENIDTIRLVGSKRISQELDDIIQAQNKYIGFRFKYDAEDVYTRSDHFNFAKRGIPIAFLFDGFHPDYHQPTDTVDKIDWTKLTNAAKLYFLVANTVANLDHRPAKNGTGNKSGI